jgi:DNA polymerase-4
MIFLMIEADRAIIHVDMDAFYAAVEQLDFPALRGKPVIVGGDPSGRGVVSTASYEARKFGPHSAMPMAQAIRLCPQAIVRPVRMKRYVEVSRQIQEIFHQFTPLVEPLSLDEAFLDVTGSRLLFGEASAIAAQIKKRIRDETQLTASVGVAPNKFLAKLASDLDKPDGTVIVETADIQRILDPLPVRRMWGIGRVTEQICLHNNLRTVGDLRRLTEARLVDLLGEYGESLYRLSRGIDDRPVVPDSAAKSVGTESTFPQDVIDRRELHRYFAAQVDEVSWRLRRAGIEAATMTLKLRFPDFKTITRAESFDPPSALFAELWEVADQLFAQHVASHDKPIRLLGITASNLRPAGTGQGVLFSPTDHGRHAAVDQVGDQIRRRFGYDAFQRGGALKPNTDE